MRPIRCVTMTAELSRSTARPIAPWLGVVAVCPVETGAMPGEVVALRVRSVIGPGGSGRRRCSGGSAVGRAGVRSACRS